MARQGMAELLSWKVDRADAAPLFRQIYLQVRSAIAAQQLRAGTRLPATRSLARQLGVARASVVTAYEELLAEGYIMGRVGSGTFVSAALPLPADKENRAPRSSRARPMAIPAHARRLGEMSLPRGDASAPLPFATGRSALDNRSLETWRRLSARALRTFGPEHLGYTDPQGLPVLRGALCDYLRAARAVRCDPEQILVTSGTQQAIDLAIRVLLRPGDPVWIEDPCYPLSHGAFTAARLRILPVPVDEEGIDVAHGRRRFRRARLAYVTPSHQYPLGVRLSMARRLALLDWAHASGAWILEDDYDSIFSYEGRPLSSLQGLDGGERVIYTGSLNKLLFPGIRLGYAVVPRALLPAFVNLRNLTDRHPASFNQAVLAAFMTEGHFVAHLRRTRLAYRAARDAVTAALAEDVSGLITWLPPEQGVHGVAYLHRRARDQDVQAAGQQQGIPLRALSRTYLRAAPRNGLILGFSGYSPEALTRAAHQLTAVVGGLARAGAR